MFIVYSFVLVWSKNPNKEPREFTIVAGVANNPEPRIPTEMAQPDPSRQQRKRPANDPRSKAQNVATETAQ